MDPLSCPNAPASRRSGKRRRTRETRRGREHHRHRLDKLSSSARPLMGAIVLAHAADRPQPRLQLCRARSGRCNGDAIANSSGHQRPGWQLAGAAWRVSM